MTRGELWRLEKYLRNLFRLDTITIVERPKQLDSVEVHVNGEFIGVLFKDGDPGTGSARTTRRPRGMSRDHRVPRAWASGRVFQ